jgi:hypothetical protein
MDILFMNEIKKLKIREFSIHPCLKNDYSYEYIHMNIYLYIQMYSFIYVHMNCFIWK